MMCVCITGALVIVSAGVEYGKWKWTPFAVGLFVFTLVWWMFT